MTWIECYVGQSTIAFIFDIAYALRRVNECLSWVMNLVGPKIGSSMEIVGECKYQNMHNQNLKRVGAKRLGCGGETTKGENKGETTGGKPLGGDGLGA